MGISRETKNRTAFAVVARPNGKLEALNIEGLGTEEITQRVMGATGQGYRYETFAVSPTAAVLSARNEGFSYAQS